MPEPGAETPDLHDLLETFLAQSRRGAKPSVEAYAAQYPDLADDIRDIFPAAVAMEQLKTAELDAQRVVARTRHDQPERVGDFRIIREIGRGGMGVVYEAEQESLGRRVAVKVLLHQALHGTDQIRRFQREAKLSARLHHTNIVTVYGVGEHAGLHYFVMELINGVSLDRVIARLAQGAAAAEPPDSDTADQTAAICRRFTGDRATNSWRAIAQFGLHVAGALQQAHDQGILHRDIKPGNVLVDAVGGTWISDFGLAKALQDEDLSRTGSTAGTLRYMAPERFQGHTTASSDLYGLGLVLYELITHRPAFADTNRTHLIHRVTHDAVPAPSASRTGVPRDLDTIVQKLTAPEPRHRYKSAAALTEDLCRFLDGRPVAARPLSRPARLWRWARRNPGLAGLSAASVLLAASALFGTSFGLVQTRQALTREKQERQRAEANAALALEAVESIVAQFAPLRLGAHSAPDIADSGATALELPSTPVLSTEAAALLQDLMPLYDRLAAESGDEQQVRQKAAAAAERMGDVQFQLGQYARAEESYHKAHAMVRDLATAPDSTQHVLAQVRIHNALGQLYKAMGRSDEAQQAHRSALDTAMTLPEAQRARQAAQLEMARTHFLLGAQPKVKGPPGRKRDGPERPDRRDRRARDAEEHLRQATQLLNEMLQVTPDNPECLYLLALCHRERPNRHRPRDAGGTSAGQAEAMAILEQLVQNHPSAPEFRYELARCCSAVHLKHFSNDERELRRGEEQLRRGLEHMEWLVRRHPYVSRYAAGRAQISHKLSALYRQTGRAGEAEKHCRRAVDELTMLLERNPDVATYTVWLGAYTNSLADLLRRTGRTAEARRMLEANLARLRSVPEQDRVRAFATDLAEQADATLTRLPIRDRPARP